jgi:two-component system cell cycle sensor histidine kinase/response regulator CckA
LSRQKEFEELSRQTTFRSGVGLPGRIWATGEAHWIPDLSRDENFPRSAAATGAGLRCGIGFPILHGKEILGVMEFFSPQIAQPDLPLMASLETIGSQIGQFIKRLRNQDALQASEERYRSIIETTTEGVWTLDGQDKTTFVNRRMAQMMGYSVDEMIGRPLLDLLHEKDRKKGAASIIERHQGAAEQSDFPLHRRDGKEFWVMMSSCPFLDQQGQYAGALAMFIDISERRSLEEQLRQAQKMEALDSLAGGVAHDFNNLLTIINGYSDIIRTQLPADSPVRELVREIGQAGERAASLTRQLLAFSRKQVLEPKVLNLNAIVTDTAKMLQRLIGEDVDLNSVLEPGLGRVKADAGQIEQVLINLAVNGRDAMPQGGRLTIETANVELDETYTQARSDVRPGRYVLLALTDTGCGMDEATKARNFEPFALGNQLSQLRCYFPGSFPTHFTVR